MLTCRRSLQRADGVIHLIAEHLRDETEHSVAALEPELHSPAGPQRRSAASGHSPTYAQ